MKELSERKPISFEETGNPPESYKVALEAPGLSLDRRRIIEQKHHEFVLYLHHDYPRRPPVIKWQTPIFHPNLLGPERNGGVCIGAWSASESVADLVTRLIDLVCYRSFSLRDALDSDAAAWVERFKLQPGFDIHEVLGVDVRLPDVDVSLEVSSS